MSNFNTYHDLLSRINSLQAEVDEAFAAEADAERFAKAGYLQKSDVIESRYYMVRRDWSCTCKSFQYQQGTDARGYCKHIRRQLRSIA